MQSELRAGEIKITSGVVDTWRSGPYGEGIVSELQGRYFELARYGRIFHTMVKGVTIAATHNTPIAAVTATPILGFLNPIGNTKAAVLLRVGFSTVSGTPAGGQAVLNAIGGVTTPPSTAATGSIFSAIVGNTSASPQGSTMRPENNVALTALAPIVGNEVLLVGAAAAAAAAGNGGPGPAGEDIGGSIIVPPATLLALMAGTGAGTTWIVNASLTWAEIDWPLI